MRPLVLAITGASGAAYGVRLLQMLLAAEREVHLTLSPSGISVIQQELSIDLSALIKTPPGKSHDLPVDADLWLELMRAVPQRKSSTDEKALDAADLALRNNRLRVHHYQDFFTPIASGSYLTDGMVVCPCSGGTLSGIVRSNSGNLIERAAEVHLKERRPLIVVPRETPLSTFQIENMYRASQAGIVVLPAAPGWYQGVNHLGDLIDFVVSRILDQLHVSNTLINRWQD